MNSAASALPPLPSSKPPLPMPLNTSSSSHNNNNNSMKHQQALPQMMTSSGINAASGGGGPLSLNRPSSIYRKKSISSTPSETVSSEPRAPKWTVTEDDTLRTAVEEQQQKSGGVGSSSSSISTSGINWDAVATKMSAASFSRNADQCVQRWSKVTADAAAVKGPWTEDEDAKVVDLVAKLGAKQWSKIATHLPGRIGKQCRERWHNHLNPAICKEAWKLSEDRTILECHVTVGNRWAEMAKLLPGRYVVHCGTKPSQHSVGCIPELCAHQSISHILLI
jgi:hypothetical protein